MPFYHYSFLRLKFQSIYPSIEVHIVFPAIRRHEHEYLQSEVQTDVMKGCNSVGTGRREKAISSLRDIMLSAVHSFSILSSISRGKSPTVKPFRKFQTTDAYHKTAINRLINPQSQLKSQSLGETQQNQTDQALRLVFFTNRHDLIKAKQSQLPHILSIW